MACDCMEIARYNQKSTDGSQADLGLSPQSYHQLAGYPLACPLQTSQLGNVTLLLYSKIQSCPHSEARLHRGCS